MGRIRALESHVVNQIAAGEVIERPASVVKELVENALDAGARRVDVRVEEGGRAVIEVADDGWGMDAEDVGRAFLPHATSKVTSVEDLTHIGSLGFRGEALASLGSVARVRITSRPTDSSSGWTLTDDHGALGTVAPAAASLGTVVRVEGLFGRVPARRKFLRTPATELGHIAQLMGRFAVAFPDVAFSLTQGARVLLQAPPAGGRRERIACVHGDEVARALLSVEERAGDLLLEGWIGPPSLHRGDGRLEQVFVGGRFIRDRTVAHAVRQAYADLMPPGHRRPVAFLFLACDPARLDVNVHPAKAEVRWHDPGAVHRLVFATLRPTLEGAAPGVQVPLSSDGPPPSTVAAVEFAFTHGVGRPERARFPGFTPVIAEGDGTSLQPTAAPGTASSARRPLRPVGQALGTYLVLEGDEAIVLIDQHALHERVLFDRISARLQEKGSLEVQRLLVPAVVHVGPAEAATLTEERDLLASLGWEIEPFGDDAVAVQGMPALLKSPDPEAALRDMLESLTRGVAEGIDATSLVKDAVDRLACRAAVMAGDVLHEEEVMALLEQAEALNHAHTCPHGRPTRLTITRSQLERWFHR